jgi:hypothetical protein
MKSKFFLSRGHLRYFTYRDESFAGMHEPLVQSCWSTLLLLPPPSLIFLVHAEIRQSFAKRARDPRHGRRCAA